MEKTLGQIFLVFSGSKCVIKQKLFLDRINSEAFNWKPPEFGHLPLLMNPDGSKLSKRQGDIKINHYRENGIFPLAVMNFIVQSGGGFAKDLEKNMKPKCYTLEELTDQFSVSQINAHSGKLMPERLLEFNRLELKRRLENKSEESLLIKEVRSLLESQFSNQNSNLTLQLSDEHIKYVLNWASNRIEKLSDLVSQDLIFLWSIPNSIVVTEEHFIALDKFSKDLCHKKEFEKDKLKVFLKEFTTSNNINFSNFMKMLRSVLSGLKEGPGVAEMMEILGKENTLNRIEYCLRKQENRLMR